MTSATDPKTITLGGQNVPSQHEAKAGGAITPGHLLRGPTADGEVLVHNQADNLAEGLIAREFDLTGRGIDDAYAQNDQVLYSVFRNGDWAYMILASGQNVAKGALLTSNGNGQLKVAGSTSFVVGRALEAVNATAGALRIRVEIMLGKAAASAN
jgi:hypothetical protein